MLRLHKLLLMASVRSRRILKLLQYHYILGELLQDLCVDLVDATALAALDLPGLGCDMLPHALLAGIVAAGGHYEGGVAGSELVPAEGAQVGHV